MEKFHSLQYLDFSDFPRAAVRFQGSKSPVNLWDLINFLSEPKEKVLEGIADVQKTLQLQFPDNSV